jgi:hypothetical protein
MRNILKASAILLALLLSPAFAQSVGQLQPGHVWGNGTAAQAPAQDTTPSKIFDQYFTCTTQGSLLDRGASLWSCLPPTANSLLITNGSGVPAWGTSVANSLTLTTASANALAVGPNGTTNPALQVDSSATSAVTGIDIVSASAGGSVAIKTLSSGTNENMSINAKGSGFVAIGNSSTGGVSLASAGTGVNAAGFVNITSNSADALAVGPNGTTNPAFQVDASATTAATGLGIQAAAAGSGVNVVALSSGTNESMSINAKGTGIIRLGGSSTGGVDLGSGGTGVTVHNALTATGLVTFADMASAALATSSQYIAGTSSTLVPSNVAYTAETTTTYGATTTFDFSTFINTAVTLTGNITTMSVANVKAGQAGQIRFIQDATGSRTTVWNSVFKFAGGTTPALSTGANDVDVLFYSCVSSSICYASLSQNMK